LRLPVPWVSFVVLFSSLVLYSPSLFLLSGIGKTTTFQAFTDVCSVVFPSVVPIYITCLNLNAEHPLATHALYRTILNNLQSRGYIQFDEADEGKTTQELLFAKLEHYPGGPLRILIMIDELDLLYMKDPKVTPQLCVTYSQNLHRVLTETGYLGEQKSGFILTFLYGSSTRLYQLVTAVKTTRASRSSRCWLLPQTSTTVNSACSASTPASPPTWVLPAASLQSPVMLTWGSTASSSSAAVPLPVRWDVSARMTSRA